MMARGLPLSWSLAAVGAALAVALLLGPWRHPDAAADEADAAPPGPPVHVVIEHPRGGQTDERVVEIRGRVTGLEREMRLTLVLNGVRLTIPREGEGFATRQVLAPGRNTIRVLADEDGRQGADEVSLHALVPPKDLRITLTWDTPGTDVDLWVTGPDGEKVFYQAPQGKAGGTLDVDVTTGWGPETYTQAHAPPGTYRVQAHYYRGEIPSRIQVTVTEGEGTPAERRRAYEATLLATNDVVEVAQVVIDR